jgi:predicted amidohydrolase
MRIAIHQGAGQPGQVRNNLEAMRHAAEKAASRSVDLLIFPEMFLTGYHIGDQVKELAEPVDGPAAGAVSAMARSLGLAILYGYAEREGPAIYNAALLVDRQGAMVANCRKAHLFGSEEKRLFRPGGHLVLAHLEGLKVGILICYDAEFPEAVRHLALSGADLLAVPTALMEPYAIVATTVMPTRAWENQVFIAYANRCGVENGMTYTGLSCILAPDGSELARAGHGEDFLTAEIDPEAYAESRRNNPYLTDRRPALYGVPTDKKA